MAADGTGAGDNSPEARNKVIADTLKIVSSSLLGVSCRLCSMPRSSLRSDFANGLLAMRAVFEPAFDWQQWRVPDARRISLYTNANREQAAAIDQEAQKIAEERAAKQKLYMAEALDKELLKYEEPLKTELQRPYEKPENERTEEQVMRSKSTQREHLARRLVSISSSAAEELKKYDAKIAETQARKPVEEFIRAMTEVPDRTPETFLFHRGDHQQPKQKSCLQT